MSRATAGATLARSTKPGGSDAAACATADADAAAAAQATTTVQADPIATAAISITRSIIVRMTFDEALAKMIDHTHLRPDGVADEIDRLCAEARRYGFKSVCVQPTWVAVAARALTGS